MCSLPLNGGSYNILLNATTKGLAAICACLSVLSYLATGVVSAVRCRRRRRRLVCVCVQCSITHPPTLPPKIRPTDPRNEQTTNTTHTPTHPKQISATSYLQSVWADLSLQGGGICLLAVFALLVFMVRRCVWAGGRGACMEWNGD